jgi:uncharacterized protein (TIGR03435 family)
MICQSFGLMSLRFILASWLVRQPCARAGAGQGADVRGIDRFPDSMTPVLEAFMINGTMQRSLPACAVFMALAIAAGAQTPTEKPSAFDAVSVKPANSAAGGRVGGFGGSLQFTPGRVVGRNVTARRMVLAAYHLTQFQLAGGPAWLDSDRFDLDARSEAAADRDQLRQMLQTVLADRFKLVVHRGTKEMPVYAMIVGKKGSKLLEWKDGDPMPKIPGAPGSGGGRGGGAGPSGGGFFEHLPMQAFAETMTNDPRVGRPVIDKTGLQGLYLISFHWDEDDSFISALEDTTGLKFESQKAAMEFLTIDHIDKPSEN